MRPCVRYSKNENIWEEKNFRAYEFYRQGILAWAVTKPNGDIKTRGWQQRAAAELGLSKQTIYYYVTGLTRVPDSVFDRIEQKMNK